jgi:phage tail-like protein
MAVARDLPYLGCHFSVRWSPGDEPPAGSGFSEVVLPTFPADAIVPGGNGSAIGGRSEQMGEAASGASLSSASMAAAGGGSGGSSAAATSGHATTAPLLVLRRGFLGSLEIYQWWNDMRLGNDKRFRTLTVDLLDSERGSVVCTWEFTRARPVQLDYSPLQANPASVLIETLTLGFDKMTMK